LAAGVSHDRRSEEVGGFVVNGLYAMLCFGGFGFLFLVFMRVIVFSQYEGITGKQTITTTIIRLGVTGLDRIEGDPKMQTL
jgi:hypothetical protein